LRSDGSVYVVEIVRSSGVKLLDHHIEQAIRSAQPFPPFPSSEPDLFTEDPMPVTIDFNYKLHPRR
jgi:TonB family protein